MLGDRRGWSRRPTKGPRRKTASALIAELKALPLSSLPEQFTHIYFARAGNGLVKIGFSRELRKRIKSQQALYPEPFEILHFAPTRESARWIERAMHAHLEESHHHGEWFRPSRRFLDLIACTKLHAWRLPLPDTGWRTGRNEGPLRVELALAALARKAARS